MRLINGDCLDVLPTLPASSIDLILCDPPYGTVTDICSGEHFSHGMKGKTGWDTAFDPIILFEQYERLLRMNGAVVLFSQEPYTSRLITNAHGNVPFSYRMIWLKDHFANALIAKKAPVSYYEDILVFFKKYDTEASHPLHDYAATMFRFIDKPRKQIFAEMGHQGAFHWFLGKNSIQFGLCTEATYGQLCDLYAINNEVWFKSYSELDVADRKFKDRLNRRFNLPGGEKFLSNVLQFRKDYGGLHPTQKPVALIDRLIRTYSNEGDTVLDNCMGSGTTGVACVNLARKFIGIERDEKYFEIARQRIAPASTLFDNRTGLTSAQEVVVSI